MIDKKVPRKILGYKWDKVSREWMRLHNEEFHDLNSPNIIQVTKSTGISWARHVAHMGDRRGACRVLVGRPEGRDNLEDPGIDGRILKQIFQKWDGEALT